MKVYLFNLLKARSANRQGIRLADQAVPGAAIIKQLLIPVVFRHLKISPLFKEANGTLYSLS